MKSLIIFITLLTMLYSCSSSDQTNNRTRIPSSIDLKYRGNDYDYDKGPSLDSNWVDLFADTPNYRGFGQKVIGGYGEKFRWIFGPMWYRGRLENNQVKVFVVGQEGAQDENVSNRSFTGSTGTRMQKFLRYLGISRSYLFMNTFVYTITGQYSLFGEDKKNTKKSQLTQKLRWLAQNKNSVIVSHRHKMFDEVLKTNSKSLEVVIGVGGAGKDSVVTWIKENGGKCSVAKLSKSFCEGSGKLKGIFFIGVKHPGAASARNGGSSASNSLVADFQKKADIVKKLIKEDQIILPIDKGNERNFNKSFKYGYASIPREDFAFGTNWQMGAKGTTSNRRGKDTIQFFSSKGCYNNKQYKSLADMEQVTDDPKLLKKAGKCLGRTETNCLDRNLSKNNPKCPEIVKLIRNKVIKLKYVKPQSYLTSAPLEMAKSDVPYESPKSIKGRKFFDSGPSEEYSKLLVDQFNIDYKSLGVNASLDFGPNGLYRGRFKNIKALIIADQLSHDDMFSGRALTGTKGQQFQSLLNAIGLTKSYLILRNIPIDTLDLSPARRMIIAENDELAERRNKVIDKVLKENKIKIILTVGSFSYKTVRHLRKKYKIINFTLKDFQNTKLNYNDLKVWKKRQATIKKLNIKFDKKGLFNFKGDLAIIPRADLPHGTRWWMGTSGSRVARAYEIVRGKKVYNPNYYKIFAPFWATKWKPAKVPLTKEENRSAESMKNEWTQYSF